MNFDIFIRRPILSLVISIFIVLMGLLSLSSLPITQFPDIVPPAVTVTAQYTGANSEVCAKAVATPLERSINGVPGMTYMTSTSSNNGNTLITVNFEVGTDPDLAAVNVQNRVTSVLDELPEEVIKAGVITEKEVNSILLYLNLTSTDEATDEKFIYNFADINILQELKRINGVGYAEIMGQREYSMRVWLKPDRMASYKISTDEVIEALRKQNIEAAPGKTGVSSNKQAQVLQYVLRYTGKFTKEDQYANIPIKTKKDGSMVKLREIAEVEFGSEDYGIISKLNGQPSAAIVIKQRPGSNASQVIENVKLRMAELKENTFPPGMDYELSYDVSRFLDASIHEVIKTLFEAFVLVFLVVFIFLQDWRATLIPALAVPVSLVGTFFFMQMFGFSINMLTLFALVLAIGIVVDNAIVVVEAVHAKMEQMHLSPKDATFAAMGEMSSAIISITLVMSAVFIPVSFMSGPVGVFYRQFSLTLAIAIIISGINALTLSPALCSLILRPHKESQNILAKGFNKGYDKLSDKYIGMIRWLAPRRWLTFVILIAFFVGTYGISTILPGGFIPTEDQGMFYINVTTPPGATVERTEAVLGEIEMATRGMEAIESVSTLAGYSLLTEAEGASFGMGMVNLSAWGDRKESVDDLIATIKKRTSHIKDARIEFFPPPAVPGFGNTSGFELRFLSKNRNNELDETAHAVEDFILKLREQPEIKEAFTGFNPNFPQYMLYMDYDMAAQKGVTAEKAMSNLQALFGSFYATNFIRFGQMYKVMVQALPQYREKPEDILKLYVKNKEGEMVPYSAFIRLKRVYGPEQLTRFNMYTSAMVNGSPAEGYSNSDAIGAIKRVAKKDLPRGYDFEWSGMTREEIISGNQAIYIFAICLTFVYLLLAAQYESFLLPLPILLSLPAGILGAFGLLYMLDLQNNIYAQVALVMLIGLLGKNAILIVEFAEIRRQQGLAIMKATLEGAKSRFRPILMTSFAFIAGLMPLVFADGAGALGNRSIGTAAAGGMFLGTVFGVILIPGLYVLFATKPRLKKSLRLKKPEKENKEETKGRGDEDA